MRESVDMIVVVSNDQLLRCIPPGVSLADSFALADEVLRHLVRVSKLRVRARAKPNPNPNPNPDPNPTPTPNPNPNPNEVEAEADGLRRGEAELASLAVHESALAERPLRAAAQA